ncbi:MAG TPA: biotin--[acetyl-CoA-carboxylase] ligase [Granulicella sp.]|nr:biotin--[acetyl-CoA-carboxylase] ligase [Granulicella sp.]
MNAPAFDLASVHKAIANTRFAGKLEHFESIGSTNLHAVEAAGGDNGAPDGSVYIADQQIAGRGRGGHSWHSAPGDGLYLSVLLRPHQMAMADALWLSLSTGLAAQRAIHQTTSLTPDIRWPNDLLLGGGPDSRKVGGILVESASTPSQASEPARLRFAVIGIGINVNHEAFPAELAHLATSLRRETGQPHARETLLQNLLLALDDEIYALELELRNQLPAPQAGLLDRFTAASTWVRGKRVRVDEAGGYTGETAGLDARGFLRVAGDDGTLHTVLSGGVRPE